MMLRKIISIPLVLLTSTLSAQYKTDAFGIFENFDASSDRNNWAGYQEHIRSDGALRGSYIGPDQVDTLTVLAGPESAIAGNEIIHIAVVGQDIHGNMVPDATDITIDFGKGGSHQTRTKDGISDYDVRTPIRAGHYNISAYTDTRQSKRIEYRVVPDWQSAQTVIQPSVNDLTTDEVVELETNALVDQFGNSLGDGVAVQFQLTDSNDHDAQRIGITVGGVATGAFITREIEGKILALASVGTTPSRPITFGVEPLRAAIPPTVSATRRDEIGAVEVTIGPFLTRENYLLHDGTQIDVTASNGDKLVNSSGYLSDGYATVTVLLDPSTLPLKLDIASDYGNFSTMVTEIGDPIQETVQ